MPRKHQIGKDGTFVDFGRKLTKAEKKAVRKEVTRVKVARARAQGKTGGR